MVSASRKRGFSGLLVDGLVALLVLSLVSLSKYSWGRYLFLLVLIIIAAVYTIKRRGFFRFKLEACQKLWLVFGTYTLLSAIWAINPSNSVSKAVTLGQIVVCFYPIYAYYRDVDQVENLINAIKWGSFAVTLYTIFYFGLDNLRLAGTMISLRAEDGFANANNLGLVAATMIFLQFWQFIFQKCKKWELVCIVPALLVIAACQSRKSFVFAVAGPVLLYFLKTKANSNILSLLPKLLFGLVLFGVVLYYLSKLEIFSAILERMMSLVYAYTGEGKTDNSVIIRTAMRELGIVWWLKSPIIGWGIGNPHIFAAEYLGKDTYLHNNYVELLCGGGIVGCGLYYMRHIYCLIHLQKIKSEDVSLYILGISWTLLILLMDYGMVSYYSKLGSLYMMTVFLIVNQLRSKQSEAM